MGVAVMTIRPMTVDDLAAVVALESANQPRPWSEQVFKDELAAENRIYLVAETDGDRSVRIYPDRVGIDPHRTGPDPLLTGFGGVMVIGDEAHITNLLVSPDRRGEGFGRGLMVALIRKAVEAGARHLTLEVRKENEAARRLYSRLGLAPVGVRPRYYGDDDALILWAHDIDRPEYLEGLS